MAVITSIILARLSRQRADNSMLYTLDDVSKDGRAEAFPEEGLPSLRGSSPRRLGDPKIIELVGGRIDFAICYIRWEF